MAIVSADEGIGYGFRLIGYMIAVGVSSFVIIGIGAWLVQDSTGGLYGGTNPGGILFGALILLFGILVFWAGVMGIQYKVKADAHYRAMQEAEEV